MFPVLVIDAIRMAGGSHRPVDAAAYKAHKDQSAPAYRSPVKPVDVESIRIISIIFSKSTIPFSLYCMLQSAGRDGRMIPRRRELRSGGRTDQWFMCAYDGEAPCVWVRTGSPGGMAMGATPMARAR